METEISLERSFAVSYQYNVSESRQSTNEKTKNNYSVSLASHGLSVASIIAIIK